jgi:hypothetical protein
MLHLFFYLTSDLSIDLNINLKDDLMRDSIIIKELKEWNRIYWMEKNRMMPLHWSIRDMKTAYEKYFPRVWNTFDTEDTTEEFENAWKDYITSTKSVKDTFSDRWNSEMEFYKQNNQEMFEWLDGSNPNKIGS